MKFIEIKETLEATKNVTIEVKKYLPFVQKTMFVNDMVESCIEENENNMKFIDFTQKAFCFDIYVLRDYAEIEFDQDSVIEQYDYLKSNNIVNYIYSEIDERELKELTSMVENTINQEITLTNSVEGVVSKGIQNLISKIPESGVIDKWVKSAVKSLKGFDPAKYEKLNEMLDYSKGADLKKGE
jgi:hypothetical protein